MQRAEEYPPSSREEAVARACSAMQNALGLRKGGKKGLKPARVAVELPDVTIPSCSKSRENSDSFQTYSVIVLSTDFAS